MLSRVPCSCAPSRLAPLRSAPSKLLPDQFGKGAGDIAVVPRVWIDVEADATAEEQGANQLLFPAERQGGEVDVAVKAEGALALLQAAAAGDGDLGEVEEVFLQPAQGEGRTTGQGDGVLACAIAVVVEPQVGVRVQPESRFNRPGGVLGGSWVVAIPSFASPELQTAVHSSVETATGAVDQVGGVEFGALEVAEGSAPEIVVIDLAPGLQLTFLFQ